MGWNRIFDELADRKTNEGVFFAVTPANRLVELFFYARTLVKVRARQFSSDQLDVLLHEGKFSKITFSPMSVKPESIDPQVIGRYFHLITDHVLSPEGTIPQDRVCLIRLMRYLDSLDTEDGYRAVCVMAEQIQRLDPAFSLDAKTIRTRIDHAHEELGFALPVLDSRDVPDETKGMLGWMFSHRITNDSLMESIFLHYLFFGVSFARIHTAVVGSGAPDEKTGGARVIVPAGLTLQPFQSALIYRGADFLTHVRAQVQTAMLEKKPAMLSGEAGIASAGGGRGISSSVGRNIELVLSPRDIGASRLQIGGLVNVIFSDSAV